MSTAGNSRRWLILGLGTYTLAAQATVVNGLVFLIPSLQKDLGLSLAGAGLVTSMPLVGLVCGLLAWGAAADRCGERLVLVAGPTFSVAALALATRLESAHGLAAAFLLAGIGSASAPSSTGRLVVAWFPPERRGFVMAVRQAAVPVGIAGAALVLPNLADSRGIPAALLLLIGSLVVAAVACAVGLPDRPRQETVGRVREVKKAPSPYGSDRWLLRLHVSSALLAVPQFLIWTFSLVWLLSEAGLSAAAAGALVAMMHVLGAVGRLAAGYLSDRIGGRIRPLRWVSVATGVTLLALGAASLRPTPLAICLLLLASTLVVSPNAVALTAAAEKAGPAWSGRVLGVQNTGQSFLGALVGPGFGKLIELGGYPAGFALAGLIGLVAARILPR